MGWIERVITWSGRGVTRREALVLAVSTVVVAIVASTGGAGAIGTLGDPIGGNTALSVGQGSGPRSLVVLETTVTLDKTTLKYTGTEWTVTKDGDTGSSILPALESAKGARVGDQIVLCVTAKAGRKPQFTSNPAQDSAAIDIKFSNAVGHVDSNNIDTGPVSNPTPGPNGSTPQGETAFAKFIPRTALLFTAPCGSADFGVLFKGTAVEAPGRSATLRVLLRWTLP